MYPGPQESEPRVLRLGAGTAAELVLGLWVHCFPSWRCDNSPWGGGAAMACGNVGAGAPALENSLADSQEVKKHSHIIQWLHV